MRKRIVTLAYVTLLAAFGSLPHAALAQYVPIGISVGPGPNMDYVDVVWQNQSATTNFLVDEYQFLEPPATPTNPPPPTVAYLVAKSGVIVEPAGYSFAGITAGFPSEGTADQMMCVAFQNQGQLITTVLRNTGFPPDPPVTVLPLSVSTIMSAPSQQLKAGGPVPIVRGFSMDANGNLIFMTQVGNNMGLEEWSATGSPLSSSQVYIGTSNAGGDAGSCTGYVVAPDGSGRVLFFNPTSDTTILDEYTGGFPGLWTQPAMNAPAGGIYVPVSVSATGQTYRGGGTPITQVLWDGVIGPGNTNGVNIWNFTTQGGNTTLTETPVWALPSGSVAVGMAACSNANYNVLIQWGRSLSGGGEFILPSYDGDAYVLATDGANNAMLYGVAVSPQAVSNKFLISQIAAAW